MAAVTPTIGNHCKGANADSTPKTQLYCLTGVDSEDNPVYVCATWRKFRVNCPKVNVLCNTTSEAYVAAITVCNQRLL